MILDSCVTLSKTRQRQHFPKTLKCKHKFLPAVCSISTIFLLPLFVKKRQGERTKRAQITLGEKKKMEEVEKNASRRGTEEKSLEGDKKGKWKDERNIDARPSIGKNTRNHFIMKPSLRKAENIFLEDARKEEKIFLSLRCCSERNTSHNLVNVWLSENQQQHEDLMESLCRTHSETRCNLW